VRALLVILALLVASPHVASAENVGLVVMGEVLQKPTREKADKWLRAHNLSPQANALPNDAIKTLADCFVVDDARCSTSVIDARAVTDGVITIRVEVVSKKEKDVRLTIDWFVKKHAPITARRTCENCTENLLGATVDGMLLELAKSKPGSLGRVKITSDPPGIPVLFDNETFGVTPIERDVAVGAHKARLIRDGSMGAEKDVEVKAGKTAEVVLETPPANVPIDTVPNGPEHHSRALPITMISLGTAAVGAGAVMYFVLHKEPDVNTHFSKDYKTPGMITAGAGAAVALTGVIIILATPNHSGPTVSPTADGGATIGWSGRF
jgi:hypothetical protein